MKKNTKILIGLVILAVFDVVIPIPMAVIFLIYVLLTKPPWFKELVAEIYAS